MVEAVQAVVEECRAGLARQLAQQTINGFEVFENQVLFFRGWLLGFRDQHQLGQIGLLQCRAAEVIEQQAPGDGQEKRSGFTRCGQLLTTEQTYEGVLAEVFGTLGAGDITP
ncbi:hypothetical protein D3C77_560170 [compost metagenome]